MPLRLEEYCGSAVLEPRALSASQPVAKIASTLTRRRMADRSVPGMVSASPMSKWRDAGEKRRRAAQHDREAAAQECDRTELTHDETGVAEHVTCSEDSADRHRTPRASRFAQASLHSRGNSRCTKAVISPDAVVSPATEVSDEEGVGSTGVPWPA